ncbi:UPF0489 family protein [Brevibacillus choshinensis]|uniref:UPF0489 family protein n=1 Tax=Brevibacillus choshinensis TaxID=54911 RepID=UPI002E24CE4F|nr:hypothetical protein [Brevibacillus choshinensis]
MEWFHNFDWKVVFPEQRMYIMRQHNWAFAAWEIERLKGNLRQQSLLVHVDAHLDDTPDGVFVPGLLEAKSVEQIMTVAQGHDYASGQACPQDCMQIDNFIWASVARDTIGETIFVSHQDDEVLSLEMLRYDAIHKRNENCQNIIAKLSAGCTYTHQRFRDLLSFLSDVDQKQWDTQQTKILDIDLDYFNLSEDVTPRLQPIEEIRASLHTLRNLCQWDVITIALSPEYCGGEEEAAYILSAFMEAFEIDIACGQRW